MASGKTPANALGGARPSRFIRRAHALGVPIATIARDLDLDTQSLYRNARQTPETLQRLETYVSALEAAAA